MNLSTKMPHGIYPHLLTPDLLTTPKLKAAHKRWSDAMATLTRFDDETETLSLRHKKATEEYSEKLREAAVAGADMAKIQPPTPVEEAHRFPPRAALHHAAQLAATALRDEFVTTLEEQVEEAQKDLDLSIETITSSAAALREVLNAHGIKLRRLKYLRAVQRFPEQLPQMAPGYIAAHHDAAVASLVSTLDWREEDQKTVEMTAEEHANAARRRAELARASDVFEGSRQ